MLSCCMSKEYKWCKNEPVVYKDEQERGYCVFHAPAGKKGVSPKEFEERVFSRIVPGERCDLSGVVFEDISFERYDETNPLPEISFYNAAFIGDANFRNTTFSGDADFHQSIFSGDANFYFAKFRKENGIVDFGGAIFSGRAFISGVTFSGRASFMSATFSKNTVFYKSIFSEEASFSNATFNEEIKFSNSTFSGEVVFNRVTFSREVDFHKATFGGEANFSKARFSGDANFSDVEFGGKSDFYKATFGAKTVFRGKTFLKEVGRLKYINIDEKIRFEGVDLTKVSFIGTDLRRMDFMGCTWPKSVHFEWPKKKDHDVLYDEVEIYEGLKMKGGYSRFKAFFYSDDKKFEMVETLYRRLKQKYKEDHDEQRASHWHFCEKNMFRQRNLRRRFFGLTALYGLSSGYGEEPVRAFLFLSLLIVVLSFVQGFFGVVPYSGESIYGIKRISGYFDMDCRALGALVLNTVQYATFQKVTVFKPLSLGGDFIKSLSQIALPVQTALFALAVRNRLRR